MRGIIKKIFTDNYTLGRWEYFKIIYGLFLIPAIFICITAIISPKYELLFYIFFILSCVVYLLYFVIRCFAMHRRIMDFFPNKKFVIYVLLLYIFNTIWRVIFIWYFPGRISAFYIITGIVNGIIALSTLFIPGQKIQRSVIIPNKIFVIILSVLVFIFLGIKSIGQIYYVETESMAGTLRPYDRVYASKLNNNKYERFDLIMHKYDTGKGVYNYVKRIVGLPGEKIEIKNEKVYINGELLEEDYVTAYKVPECTDKMYCSLVIPQNSYYILGDNRDSSLDSRFYGPIKKDDIVAKPTHIYWPLDRRQDLHVK